jgi:biopolymer transport protein ExbD
VAEGGLIYFDNVPVNYDEVHMKLDQMHRANPDIKISLSAETLALHGQVIDVLDKIRTVGITKVGYQIKTASVTGAPGTVPVPAPGAPPPPPKP